MIISWCISTIFLCKKVLFTTKIMNEDETETVLVREASVGSRKRRVTGGKRGLAKKKRYSAPSGSNVYTPCNHNESNKRFLCTKITPNIVKAIRVYFYSIPNKQRQDSMIANMLELSTVMRKRPRPTAQNKRQKPGGSHNYSVKYFLKHDGGQFHVCKNLFINVLQIGRTRLQNICKKKNIGDPIEEKRGGDRKSNRSVEKKNSVRNFIGQLRGNESHYNRNKSQRIYLSCDLSIKKLHEMYNENVESDKKVHFAMFRRVFVNEFNLGFRSPATDVCNYCSLMKTKISSSPKGSAERNGFIIEKRIHKQRANAFYKLLKTEVPDSLTFCFDLQQIQPLPKTNIQEAFYSRQLNFYNLCIVDLQCKKPLFYTWTEEQAGKGSLEISSGLLNFLETTDFGSLKLIRFFCDGCVAQNKNNIVLRTVIHFLYTKQNCSIKEIQFYFPVRGHSFLPADRVFGRAEKLLKKQPVIISKDDYYETYAKIGEVKKCGVDWMIQDTKSLQKYYKDLPNISDLKRIYIKMTEKSGQRSVKVRGLQNFVFESEESFNSLAKKNFTNSRLQRVKLKDLPLSHTITAEKKKDVDKLLCSMFGNEWKKIEDSRFDWYKMVLDLPTAAQEEPVTFCDCLEEEVSIRI